ncbi:aminotransferase class V-fold PLP-dependent enzyme [candidate division KSB1 bacterium]|nr:MAG: aminotransferase class V-fold PLP-dependent enzyme [candidate division KSB1 bacterium]MBC6948886.1 aminotransferase class V-fold PLP-dependent enzyme [candidate division KSB1 bacterium]MCE7940541.1 aminotransferase class V-fold PLP-dependent enzyme [Chlorobi bacterium CHB1]
MHRRKFIKTAGQTLTGLFGLSALKKSSSLFDAVMAASAPRAIEPRDEAFWAMVREQFPLTHERIYLNTGGLGASPYVVIEAVKNKITELERICETGHSEELWHDIKSKAGQILGCKPEELAYMRNATEGIAIVCNGLPLKRGDEVITTTHEHVGNTLSWLARQKRDGIVMKAFEPSTQSAQENLERMQKLLTKRTRALSIPHITTSTGQILPVKQIGEWAAANKLWYFIDGAQAAGMLPMNLHDIGCHAYAASGHKWLLGPKGTGLLYVRADALDLIESKYLGGYSNTGEFDMRTGAFQFHPTAQRYEYGTVSTPLFAGLGAAMEFLLKIGMENIWRRNLAMAAALKEGLNKLGVEVNSPQHPEEHSAIITFTLKNMDRSKLQNFLSEKYKLRTRGIYEGGLDAIRISLHLYNSFAEVDKVLEAVQAAKSSE